MKKGNEPETPPEMENLIERASRGDQEAIASLYKLYENRMVAVVHYKLGHTLHNLMESVDLVQSVWKDVLDDLHGFEYQGPDSFYHWLRTCVINKIHSKRRYHVAEKRDAKKMSPLPGHDWAAGDGLRAAMDPTPSQIVSRHEEADQLMALLDRFPPLQRRVLVLRMRDEMGYAQIGAGVGKSTEAAKKIYNRALKKLIDLIPHEWEGSPGGGQRTSNRILIG